MLSADRDLPLDFTMDFKFSGEIYPWRGPSPYHFIDLPDEIATELRSLSPVLTYGWGVIPVSARIGDTDFQTSLFPRDGGYALPIKDKVRKAEDLTDGDAVTVAMTLTLRQLPPEAP